MQAIEELAGEIAGDALALMPDQTLDMLGALREAIQRRLECPQGRAFIRRIAEGGE